jgi:malate synthase
MSNLPNGVKLTHPIPSGGESILTPDALAFLALLHRTFNATRLELLEKRKAVQHELDNGKPLGFLPETKNIRESVSWQCAPPAPGLEDRR